MGGSSEPPEPLWIRYRHTAIALNRLGDRVFNGRKCHFVLSCGDVMDVTSRENNYFKLCTETVAGIRLAYK